MPANGELKIRMNRPTDDYNRIIEISPVQKLEQAPEMPGGQTVIAHGLKVSVDFNNRDMHSDLDTNKIRGIIQSSIEFNKKELYDFLNMTGGST